MRCIFHVLAAGSAFTVRAGSQSTKKRLISDKFTRTHTYTHQFRVGRIGESRVKGQRRKRERGEEREREKNIKGREGEGGEGAKDWKGAGRGWEIDSEERQEKAVSIFFFFLHNA